MPESIYDKPGSPGWAHALLNWGLLGCPCQDDLTERCAFSVLPRVQPHQYAGLGPPRKCRVDQKLVASMQEIDTGSIRILGFWQAYSDLFKAYMLGAKGVSSFMLQIRDAMCYGTLPPMIDNDRLRTSVLWVLT